MNPGRKKEIKAGMLRVFFAGSPRFAVPALEKAASAHRIAGILTAPPSPKGRSSVPVPSEVEEAAIQMQREGKIPAGVPVLHPEKITDEVRAEIAALHPDVLLCFAYGKIFSGKTLSLFPKGAFNIHPSLLPRWRGPSPVPAAILAQDAETGVSLQRISREMDAGNLLAVTRIPLTGTETTGALLDRLALLGAELVPGVLDGAEQGTLQETPQTGEPTFSRLLRKEDGEIDWSRPAAEINAKIRAFYPWPGAYTRLPDGTLLFLREAEVLRIPEQHVQDPGAAPGTVLETKRGLWIQTGDGVLSVLRLQRQTKKETDWRAFLNGNRDLLSRKLGDS